MDQRKKNQERIIQSKGIGLQQTPMATSTLFVCHLILTKRLLTVPLQIHTFQCCSYIECHPPASSALPFLPEDPVTIQQGCHRTGPTSFTDANDIKSLALGNTFQVITGCSSSCIYQYRNISTCGTLQPTLVKQIEVSQQCSFPHVLTHNPTVHHWPAWYFPIPLPRLV